MKAYMSKRAKFDAFDCVHALAIKAKPKSKHPICDFITNVASDLDPESLVVPEEYARQMEYNWHYYEKKYKNKIKNKRG